jgi:hypothetical protein
MAKLTKEDCGKIAQDGVILQDFPTAVHLKKLG